MATNSGGGDSPTFPQQTNREPLLSQNGRRQDDRKCGLNCIKSKLELMVTYLILVLVNQKNEPSQLRKREPTRIFRYAIYLNITSLFMVFAFAIFVPNNYSMVMFNSTYRNLEKKKVNEIFLMDGAYHDIILNVILIGLYHKVKRHLRKIRHYRKVMHFESSIKNED